MSFQIRILYFKGTQIVETFEFLLKSDKIPAFHNNLWSPQVQIFDLQKFFSFVKFLSVDEKAMI